MIKIENYPNAYKEVYIILNNMNKKDVELIPQSFIKMLKNNMNKDYDFKLDTNKDFDEQEILKETKAILAYIFLNYWVTNKQKDIIDQKFKQDIAKEENEKTNRYSTNDLFKKSKTKDKQNLDKQSINETAIIEYKETIFQRIRKKFKALFTNFTNY